MQQLKNVCYFTSKCLHIDLALLTHQTVMDPEPSMYTNMKIIT